MFIATYAEADIGYLIELRIDMPYGAVSCTAVPRFVGDTPHGHGIGVELHVMDRGDRELWNVYYRRQLAEAVARAD